MNKRNVVIAGVAGAIGLAAGLSGILLLRAVSARAVAPEERASAASVPAKATLGQSMVTIEPVKVQPVHEKLRINGRLAFNAMRVQQISSRVPGRVEKIMVFEGAAVRSGDPIALLYSPEYVSAQNEFILARNTARMLSGKATADLQEDAKVTLESARNRLKVLSVTEGEIAALEKTGGIQQHMVIRSPLSGRITKRNVDPGGYLDTGASLGTVADLSSLWFLGNAYETDLPRLREGQTVELVVAGVPAGKPLRGRVSFIAPTIDAQTHTAVVRVELINRGGSLKPDMFAQAEVALEQRMLPVVPRAAVVQDGAESFVMVQRGVNKFERVPVQAISAGDENRLAILSGVKEGDRIVMEGSVLVDRNLTNPQNEKAPTSAPSARYGASQ